ncbi:hypothetical protein [Urbifossiella limnaea]|uniref:SWIM-type domain-containing protein n=1 Tax=Urbifossiella limnaea TaxID=2528023 RepID=A0A517XNF6_9BACT|nr:hypothetical protein [Urbifossiella limnaea]QDU19041.1 hypothetical protein ETAA1_09440 [Urbifossiella limnaea]
MPDLRDGESLDVPGSNGAVYTIKNVGGVYACTCMAWRTQSAAVDRRTCKHLRRLRGDAAEDARVGLRAAPPKPSAKGGKPSPAPPPVTLPNPAAAHTLPAPVEADAIVTAYQFAGGRLIGLLCRLGDGQAVGVSSGLADHPPAVGSIVGLRFQKLSATGVPVAAGFAGARTDDAATLPVPAALPVT